MAEPIEIILAYDDPFEFSVSLFERAQEKVENSGFNSLNAAERAAFCIYPLDAEVKNGGFDQYLWNPSGDYAEETIRELYTVGALRTAVMLEMAVSAFGEARPSKDWLERQAQMEVLKPEVEQRIREQDDKYYEGEEDPLGLLRSYVLGRTEAIEWNEV